MSAFSARVPWFGLVALVLGQGRESSQDEIGASALLATEMDDKLNGLPVQVRSLDLRGSVVVYWSLR